MDPRWAITVWVPGPSLTTATWRCRKNFSQWECSFHWKLCCHWLEFLRQRQIAVVGQGPGLCLRQIWPRSMSPHGVMGPNELAAYSTFLTLSLFTSLICSRTSIPSVILYMQTCCIHPFLPIDSLFYVQNTVLTFYHWFRQTKSWMAL